MTVLTPTVSTGTPTAIRESVPKLDHLLAGSAALLVLIIGAFAFDRYAISFEQQYIEATAPEASVQKNQGIALQTAAFNDPNLLPVYGSSELLPVVDYLADYQAPAVFKTYPTGFQVLEVGKEGTGLLIAAERLAALGSTLRGKKLVLSLSPGFFFANGPMDTQAYYAGNFSVIQAYGALTSGSLTSATRCDLARRMLDYPATLESDRTVEYLTRQLGSESRFRQQLSELAWPLIALEKVVLRLQDHWESIQSIEEDVDLAASPPPHVRADLDWPLLVHQAERKFGEHAANNAFSVDDDRWNDMYKAIADKQVNHLSDQWFGTGMATAKGWWTDLDLVLRVLKECDARPLIVCMPIHGQYYDSCNVSLEARSRLYQRLSEVASRYGFPIATFQQHDGDAAFFLDFSPHLSPKGWVYYDCVFDAWFHDSQIDPAEVVADLDNRADPAHAGHDSDPGSLDGAGDDGAIGGWAWDSAHPDSPVSVDIYIDTVLAGRAVADQFRSDLAQAGKGSGHHAFSFAIPATLCDGRQHTVEVKNVSIGEPLHGSPKIGIFNAVADSAVIRPVPASAPATRPADPSQTEPSTMPVQEK